jgi:hypothetical protein
MGKLKTNLQQKKEHQLALLERGQTALREVKRQVKATDNGNRKRKEVADLVGYLELPSRRYELRPAEKYATRSYNLANQILGLIDHLFGRYRAPTFLYQAMLNPCGHGVVVGPWRTELPLQERQTHRAWLLAALRGESVAKAMKGVLTKMEAHWFMQAPHENTIVENLFWAKCAAAGLPGSMSEFLTQHFGEISGRQLLGDRTDDLIRFYAQAHSEMGRYDLREITDFVREAMRHKEFLLKGRTFESVRKLSEEWHRNFFGSILGQFQCWKPMFDGPWEAEIKRVNVFAYELTNNRMLIAEGRKQRHCVGTYTTNCVEGFSRIVSLRFYAGDAELTRLTIEIKPKERQVVQIRGTGNRHATDDERKAIRRWAGDHGLVLGNY